MLLSRKISSMLKSSTTNARYFTSSKSQVKMSAQNFDFFFVLDFEATCIRDGQIEPQEVIEFPCVKVDAKDFSVEAKFHRYVRPIHHPNLSHFCTELTGITQDMVEHESDFSTVFSDFRTWIEHQAGSDRFTLVTCGDWDLKTMLPKQCSLSGADIPVYAREWINIKKSYHAAKRIFPRSLPAMLTGLGMTFEGRQHCGMDDTVNIVRILAELGRQGHVFANTTSRRI